MLEDNTNFITTKLLQLGCIHGISFEVLESTWELPGPIRGDVI